MGKWEGSTKDFLLQLSLFILELHSDFKNNWPTNYLLYISHMYKNLDKLFYDLQIQAHPAGAIVGAVVDQAAVCITKD